MTRERGWAEAAHVLAVVVASVYAHRALGFVCPLPWPDESHFLWPAVALAEHGTFLTPVLNPDRVIFWMPHGYAAVMGALFAAAGSSLELARAASLVCVLAAFVVLLRILRVARLSLLSAIVAGAFFVNAYFIGCGNVARMEALLLLLVLGATLQAMRATPASALGLLLLAPLVHPNGLYFLAVGVLATAVVCWRTRAWPHVGGGSAVVLAVAALAWIAYGAYLAEHLTSVREDLAFQFARKAERSIVGQILTRDNLALLVLLALAVAGTAKRHRSRLALLALAVPCWTVQIVGFEMWYRVFWMMTALIVTVLFVEAARDVAVSRLQSAPAPARWAVAVGALLAVLAWHLARGNVELPVGYPFRMRFFEMSTPDGTAYLTGDDRARVTALISDASARRPVTVQFFPRAEAFFYLDLRSDRVRFSDPLFTTRPADLYVFHVSRYLPPRWIRFLARDMTEAGLDPQAPGVPMFGRDDTEQWFVYRPVP